MALKLHAITCTQCDMNLKGQLLTNMRSDEVAFEYARLHEYKWGHRVVVWDGPTSQLDRWIWAG